MIEPQTILKARFKGSFWVKIGEYGTPHPYLSSDCDEFQAKCCFRTYYNLAQAHWETNDDDEVMVCHCVYSPLNKEKKPPDCIIFFSGSLKEAKEWLNESDEKRRLDAR